MILPYLDSTYCPIYHLQYIVSQQEAPHRMHSCPVVLTRRHLRETNESTLTSIRRFECSQ